MDCWAVWSLANLTTKQAAKRLGVSAQRVRAMIGAKQLKAEKFGKSHVIRERDLAAVATRTVGRPARMA